MLSRSCFSVTMASRFEIVDEEYIEELEDKIENENTKNNTEYGKNVFKKWVNERNFKANLEEYESGVLDQTLSQFYAFRNSEIFLCTTRLISASSENTSDINHEDPSLLLINNIEGKINEFLNVNCPRRCATRATSATSENK